MSLLSGSERPAAPEATPVGVRMVRLNLDQIPQYPLPPGFALREYRPGDAETWVRIHQRADNYGTATLALFREQFGGDEKMLAERQLFLCDANGLDFGTATAWFNDDYHGLDYGRVHWVAIEPAWQGQGLSRPLLTAVCHRLTRLGHTRAYLTTHTARVAAIGLYLKFGFIPEVRDAADLAAWRGLRERGVPVPLPEGV